MTYPSLVSSKIPSTHHPLQQRPFNFNRKKSVAVCHRSSEKLSIFSLLPLIQGIKSQTIESNLALREGRTDNFLESKRFRISEISVLPSLIANYIFGHENRISEKLGRSVFFYVKYLRGYEICFFFLGMFRR